MLLENSFFVKKKLFDSSSYFEWSTLRGVGDIVLCVADLNEGPIFLWSK